METIAIDNPKRRCIQLVAADADADADEDEDEDRVLFVVARTRTPFHVLIVDYRPSSSLIEVMTKDKVV